MIPTSVIDFTTGNGAALYPGAITLLKDKILFGISSLGVGTPFVDGLGVWSISPEGVLNYEYRVSSGASTSANVLSIGVISSGINGFLMGYQDNTTRKVDQVSIYGSYRTSSYNSYILSELYEVGTHLVKKKFTQIEFVLAKPLGTTLGADDGIRLKARPNLSASFTTIGTVDYTGNGAISSYNFPFPLDAMTSIQIKIELQGNTQLKQVRLR
jgi:hypothetical protein